MSEPAIEVERVSRAFRGRPVLRDISLTVNRGECAVVVGPNGSGKTTLVEIVATLLKPTTGSARVLGHDVVRAATCVRALVGYCPSKPDSFYPRLTGRGNLHFFAALSAVERRAADRTIDALLDELGLRLAADELVQTYSDGMKARLAIARTLLPDPPVLLLDEPSKSLDAEGKLRLRTMFADDSRRRAKTRLWITHDATEGAAVADRMLELADGELRVPSGVRA